MQNPERELKPLKIAISGSSGFIGSAAAHALRERGHEVRPILRIRSNNPNAIYWNPYLDIIEPAGLENLDVVINLSGKTIKAKRWSENDKAEFKDSRLKSTRLLDHAISRLKKAPKRFLSVSAVGYYGDTGNEPVTERAQPGSGFLAQLCREWEMATWEAEAVGITVNHLRLGVVLSPQGGLLKILLPYFRYCLSATIGTGEQYLPWITLTDTVNAIVFMTENAQAPGAINVVAPTPLTNRDFTKSLAKAVHRPTFLKFSPSFVRRAFGEVGSSILLDSSRAVPERLAKAGFEFAHPDFNSALKSFF
jgi:uncharacterized protein (TIGR01777 family)